MPPFKDENIIIIAPGSQTCLAQLGLPESFTPPSHRFPSRMFLAPDGKTYEPHKIKSRPKAVAQEDTEMGGTEGEAEEIYEDVDDLEGAVYPLKGGRIVDMPAFFALLHHIHNTLSPTLHTPIMLLAQPCWTAKNHEDITQFIFERFKTPALCIMDSALATSYAFGVPNATIVDVGYEKTDVTAITDFQISGRGSVAQSGGEAMTQKLVELLKNQQFTRDMAEQLKMSTICEILPPGIELPGKDEAPEVISNPAAAASTGATSSGPTAKVADVPRGPGPETEVGEADNGEGDAAEDDGVLDVASIVASGKTQEFLAKKEKEKAEKAALRKANKDKDAREAAEAANKPAKLPNSKRARAIFYYETATDAKRHKAPEADEAAAPTASEDLASAEVAAMQPSQVSTSTTDPTSATEPKSATSETAATVLPDGSSTDATKQAGKRKRAEDSSVSERREIEIGTERFLAASDGILDAIADTVYRTVLSVDDISKRQDAWDALVICGSGSKVRGFKEALLGTLNSRYLISPSSATMFMSELPSNMATPSGTGSMTPNASFPGASTPPHHPPPTASAVNPLLLAATTAGSGGHIASNNASLYGGNMQHTTTHSSHSQSPTSIKVVTPPTYFPEWKTYEEALFLGGQLAAKVVFVVDQGTSKGCMTRSDFNDAGPSGIHEIGLVY